MPCGRHDPRLAKPCDDAPRMIGTIVCVDDQAEVRRLLGDVFRAKGGNVVSFDDG